MKENEVKKKHVKKSVGGRPSNEVLTLRKEVATLVLRNSTLTHHLRDLAEKYEAAVKLGWEGETVSLREAGEVLLATDDLLKH